jgi:hypothetical protein
VCLYWTRFLGRRRGFIFELSRRLSLVSSVGGRLVGEGLREEAGVVADGSREQIGEEMGDIGEATEKGL